MWCSVTASVTSFLDLYLQGGNSNRGESANRFFRGAETAARILGLPVRLLKLLWRLLRMLNRITRHAKPEVYRKLAKRAHKLYSRHIHHKTMSATVHQVLVHGHEYIRSASKIFVNCLSPPFPSFF